MGLLEEQGTTQQEQKVAEFRFTLPSFHLLFIMVEAELQQEAGDVLSMKGYFF